MFCTEFRSLWMMYLRPHRVSPVDPLVPFGLVAPKESVSFKWWCAISWGANSHIPRKIQKWLNHWVYQMSWVSNFSRWSLWSRLTLVGKERWNIVKMNIMTTNEIDSKSDKGNERPWKGDVQGSQMVPEVPSFQPRPGNQKSVWSNHQNTLVQSFKTCLPFGLVGCWCGCGAEAAAQWAWVDFDWVEFELIGFFLFWMQVKQYSCLIGWQSSQPFCSSPLKANQLTVQQVWPLELNSRVNQSSEMV